MPKNSTEEVRWNLLFLMIVIFAGIVTLVVNLLYVMPPGTTEVQGEVLTEEQIRIENRLKGPFIMRVNDTSSTLKIEGTIETKSK